MPVCSCTPGAALLQQMYVQQQTVGGVTAHYGSLLCASHSPFLRAGANYETTTHRSLIHPIMYRSGQVSLARPQTGIWADAIQAQPSG
jgi:hypothetical protein